MQSIPLKDRPRERFMNVGEEALSDSELLAIIIGSGTRLMSALDLAHHLLSHFGSLTDLSEASLEELCQVHGVGRVKAIEIRAVFAVTKRLLKKEGRLKTKITNAQDAYHALIDLFYGEKKEILAMLFLDSRLNLIGREVIGIGTLTEVVVHPREVFMPAIKKGAYAVIVAHNHPSDEVAPSAEDIALTERLRLAGKVLGIELNDHLIICDDQFYSFNSLGRPSSISAIE